MPDLSEILRQDELTVEALLYQLLLGEAPSLRAPAPDRRRITNGGKGDKSIG